MDSETQHKLDKLLLKIENTGLKLEVQQLEKKLSAERQQAQEKKAEYSRLMNHYDGLSKRYKIVLNKHNK